MSGDPVVSTTRGQEVKCVIDEIFPSGRFLVDSPVTVPIHEVGASDRFASLLTWSDLNALLCDHRFTSPRLSVGRDGTVLPESAYTEEVRLPRGRYKQLDVSKLLELLREDATLSIGGIDKAHSPIRRMRRELERELGVSLSVNLYASWGSTHGFKMHWDDHDVIVVQVHGRKRWELHKPTRAWPVREDGISPEPPSGVDDTLFLESGDSFFLPRGWWHDVTALSGPSLHLTFGILRPRADDFLRWIVEQSVCHEDTRKDIPLGGDAASMARFVHDLRLVLESSVTPESMARYIETQISIPVEPRPTLEAVDKSVPLSEWAHSDSFRLLSTAQCAINSDSSVSLFIQDESWVLESNAGSSIGRLVAGEAVPVSTVLPLLGEDVLLRLVNRGYAAVV